VPGIGGEASTAVDRERLLRVAAIGIAAGFFSALFGVGGGILVVPLLIALLAYDARIATATSLAVIIVTAAVGAAAHAALDNVDLIAAVLIGLPAIAGVQIGLWIKERISTRMITYGFSALLVVVAIRMALG
jgi:uncharacterized membrane protein YfcA